MNKAKLKQLERVFAREVFGAILQADNVMLRALAEDGMVERVKHTIPRSGIWPAVEYEGYALTHRGRITYCDSCRDVPDDAP